MNNVNLVGRLAKDPAARDTGETRVTELILVTERPVIRDGKVQKDAESGYALKDAEFHKVTVFNGMGLPLREHKKKGDQRGVIGLSIALEGGGGSGRGGAGHRIGSVQRL